MKNFVIDNCGGKGATRIYGLPDNVEVVNVKNEWYLMKKQSDGTYRDYLPINELGADFIDYFSAKQGEAYYVVGGNNSDNSPYLHVYNALYSPLITPTVIQGDVGDCVFDFPSKRGVYGFTEAGSTSLFLAGETFRKVDFRAMFLDAAFKRTMDFDYSQLQISIASILCEGGLNYFDATFDFSGIEKVHAGFLIDNDMNLSFFPSVFGEQAFQEYILSNKGNMLSLDDFYSSFVGGSLVDRLHTLLNPELSAQRRENLGRIMRKSFSGMSDANRGKKSC